MKLAHFRKKPIIIEAVQVRATDFNGTSWDGSPFSELPGWLSHALAHGMISVEPSDRDYALWRINTLEDGPEQQVAHIAEPGDWIIRGIKGELYPCKPDIFASTYEQVEIYKSGECKGMDKEIR